MKLLHTLQAYRAFAALLVVGYHARNVCAFLSVSDYGVFSSLGMAGVFFFFTLSGFILFHVHERDFGHRERLGGFFLKRILRIYPLYVAVTLMLLPFWLFVSGFGRAYHKEFVPLLKSLLLIPQAHFPHLIPGWTLTHEMLFYAIFAAFLFSRRAGLWLMGAWIVAIAVATAGNWGQEMPARYFWHPMNLLFPLGMVAAVATKRMPALAGRTGLWVFLSGNALFVLGLLLATTVWREVNSVLLFGGASFLILAGSLSGEVETFFRKRTFLVTLGAASYSTYLIHDPATSATAKILEASGLLSRIPPPLFFAILVATGVTAGLLLYRFVERPLQAALKK